MRTYFLCFIILQCLCLFSQDEKEIHIFRTSSEIVLDGELSEDCWKRSQVAGDFWQNFPYDTSKAQTRTEAMVTYDDKNLYIAAICYDTLPGKYIIQSLKRDFSYPVSDAFGVYIDPFSDKTNGFCFSINPYGVQREGLLAYGGGHGVSTDWDNKWFSAVKRYPDRWIVEMAIPFKTLRYKSDLSKWRINFSRNDLKRNENSAWCAVPRQYNIASLAFTGVMVWDTLPKRTGTNISLIPYGIARANQDFTVPGNTPQYQLNAGGDAKIAISSSLNLDLTINPDFSQVDADRQVTNLSRFSLFFPERRQFFIENSDIFDRIGFRQIRPFFSRRVGLSTTGAGGIPVPIIGGARLSGKPNKNWRLGVMDVQTGTKPGVDSLANNYFVAVVQRQVFERSNISLTAVNKSSIYKQQFLDTLTNSVVGIDYNLASKDNRWFGKFFFHHSLSSKGSNNAFAHASFLNYSTEKIILEWNHEYVDKKYDPQTGFVPRQTQYDYSTGKSHKLSYWRFEPKANYFFYPKHSFINKMGPEIYIDHYRLEDFTPTDLTLQGAYDIFFANTGGIFVDYHNIFTRLLFPTDVTFSGKSMLADSGNYNYQNVNIHYKTDARKIINGNFNVNYGSYFTGNKLSLAGEINLRMQPYVIINLTLSHDEIWMPYLQKSVPIDLISPRIDVSFSRSLFFTTYLQYNAQANNFNINARLQWRFKPMSDLYIVYTDNSQPYSNNELKFIPLNKGLAVKLVYWLGL